MSSTSKKIREEIWLYDKLNKVAYKRFCFLGKVNRHLLSMEKFLTSPGSSWNYFSSPAGLIRELLQNRQHRHESFFRLKDCLEEADEAEPEAEDDAGD